MRSKNATITMLIIILVLLFAFFKWRNLEYRRSEPINRNSDSLGYSPESLCWMKCQNISEKDVANILEKGIIIFNRSNRAAQPCPTYIVRGFNQQKESIELTLLQCKNKAILIRCIKTKTKANCKCP
jgi:hypothetical protein